MELVPAGTSAQASGGETSLPLHVNLVGIRPPGSNAVLLSSIPGGASGAGSTALSPPPPQPTMRSRRPTIQQRATGRAYCRGWDESGRTKDLCARMRLMSRGPTLAAFVDEWWALYAEPNLEPATRRTYRSARTPSRPRGAQDRRASRRCLSYPADVASARPRPLSSAGRALP